MISVEQRPTPAINVVTRSGATTHTQNTENQPDEAWATQKGPVIDIEKEQETIMETKCDFVDPSTAVVPTQQHHQEL